MPNPTRGEVRFVAGCWQTRVTLRAKLRLTVRLPTCRTEAEATERSELVAEQARRLRVAGHAESRAARTLLEELGAGRSRAAIRDALQVIAELCGGQVDAVQTSDGPTFERVAGMWTGGEFFKLFPGQVRKTGDDALDLARRRLLKPAFDVVRHLPIVDVTRADCDAVMRQIPLPPGKDEHNASTLRQYALLMTRVLNLAELAGYIDRSPIPRGWLPAPAARKRFPILYPAEDRTLLGCAAVPLTWRVFYGFLHREGMRRSEAAELRWADLDLEHGTVSLDENKTDHPRMWKLGPGVAAALQRWRDQREAEPGDFVFIDDNGGPLRLDHMADRVRAHLASAELTRADLTSDGPNKGPFGTHCFRRSFVTRALALGQNEDWVRLRTGHTSDELLRYRQAARALVELEMADVDPLDQAVPELRDPDAKPAVPPVSARAPRAPRPPRAGRGRRSHRPTMAPPMVGAPGFEPGTPRPPVWCAIQAALRPEPPRLARGFAEGRPFREDCKG